MQTHIQPHRYNLDPETVHTDDNIWSALEQVELKDTIQEMDGMLGRWCASCGSGCGSRVVWWW